MATIEQLRRVLWFYSCSIIPVEQFRSTPSSPRGLLFNPPEDVVVSEGCTRRGAFPEYFSSIRGVLSPQALLSKMRGVLQGEGCTDGCFQRRWESILCSCLCTTLVP